MFTPDVKKIPFITDGSSVSIFCIDAMVEYDQTVATPAAPAVPLPVERPSATAPNPGHGCTTIPLPGGGTTAPPPSVPLPGGGSTAPNPGHGSSTVPPPGGGSTPPHPGHGSPSFPLPGGGSTAPGHPGHGSSTVPLPAPGHQVTASANGVTHGAALMPGMAPSGAKSSPALFKFAQAL